MQNPNGDISKLWIFAGLALSLGMLLNFMFGGALQLHTPPPANMLPLSGVYTDLKTRQSINVSVTKTEVTIDGTKYSRMGQLLYAPNSTTYKILNLETLSSSAKSMPIYRRLPLYQNVNSTTQ